MRLRLTKLNHLLPYIRAYKKQALIGSFCMIVLSLLALPTPYLMKFIVDDVLGEKNLKLLNLIILVLVGIQVARLVFSFLTNYLFGVFNQEILAKVKKGLFHRLLRLPLSFFDKHQSGYLLSRIGEVEGLSFFFSNTMVRLVIGCLEFLFSLVILFSLNWELTLIALAILPLLYVATRFYSKTIRRLSREVMEKGAVLSSQVQDTLSGVDMVKVCTSEERETSRIHGFLEELKQMNIRRNVVLTLSSEALTLVGAVGGFIVFWYSGWDIIRGGFTLGSYIAFSGYLGRLYGPTQMLASIGLSFQPAASALERYNELMNLAGEEERDGGLKLERLRGEIVFEDVHFSYDAKPVLHGVDFRIKPGEKVLLTGPNGSGKTTVMKLLLGLYKPQQGRIIIDGHCIEEISLSSLRERVAIISQSTFLFNDTIKNNILYSRLDATEKEVEEAMREAGVLEFVCKLEEGENTFVGERGKRLSGGEMQRIAIARAILRNADLAIFDEAATHLDQDSEQKLGDIVRKRFWDKTCILITHKPAFLGEVDHIFNMDGGKVEEMRVNSYDKLI